MKYLLARMAGEVVRLCPVASRAGAIITVSLSDAPGAVARARGVALYRVGVSFSWRDDLGVLTLATPGGDRVEWPLVKVAEWLTVIVGGWSLVVAFEFNAGRLGLPYAGSRADRQAAYMAALDVDAMQSDAVQRRADVSGLPLESIRRAKAEDRAGVVEGLAEMVELLQAEAVAAGVAP